MALIAVGSNSGEPPSKRAISGQKSGYTPTWQSPDKPCPTIRTGAYGPGGGRHDPGRRPTGEAAADE